MADPPEYKRTQFARQGLDFSVLFSAKFLKVNVTGHRPMVREPPGVSTGGGKQAMQHIVLMPNVEGDPVLTVGQVNTVTKSCKLRTYGCMEDLHERRFRGQPFVLEQGQYQEFFDKAMQFLKGQGMQVDIETRPPQMESAPRAETEASSNVVVLFLLLVLVIAGAVGVMWWQGLLF